MFTGLIEEIGILKSIQKTSQMTTVHIQASLVLEEAKIGDSIACNGICLTISKRSQSGFDAQLMPETIQKTQFSRYYTNMPLNLERAMRADARLGGHIVSGHIDTVGHLIAISKQGESHIVTIKLPQAHQGMMVAKGSIAIDGISLTIIDCQADSFSVGVIPHTYHHTILNRLKIGSYVNLEFDLHAKYAHAPLNLNSDQTTTSLSLTQLAKWGY